ncbi:MAG: hypothetical protein DRP08_04640 [Candidatus Aenigmatarchaeota archaeon]|nr:MAG: hypothetical protein DRP08_04640 [Candidatus Aenigmarchaeota archaeon]
MRLKKEENVSIQLVTKPLGQLLLEKKLISKQHLNKALKLQKKEKGLLGQILLRLKYVSEEDIVVSLATQFGYSYLPVANYKIAPEVIKLIPKDIAYRYYMIPVNKINKILTVAMLDPSNKLAIENIEQITECKVQVFVSTSADIEKAIKRYYGSFEEKNV